VCQSANDLPIDVLADIASLLDKSLVQRHEGSEAQPRFMMLETVRVYARAKLFESGEAASLRSHHLTFYLNLAEKAAPKLWGEDPRLLDQLEQEHGNLRAALQWAREQNDVETLARLVDAIFAFWFMRGYWREGGDWVEAVLAQHNHLSPSRQAEMLTIYGELVVRLQGEDARAKQIFEEALALRRTLADPAGMAWALNRLGETALYQGEYAQAETYWAESLRLYREIGDNSPWALYGLGNVVRLQGDTRRAEALLEEALVIAREVGRRRDVAWSLTRLGQIRLAQGNCAQATALLKESLAGYQELRQSFGLAESLVALGGVALAQQHPARAVQLFGAADKLLGTTHWRMAPKDKTEYDRNVATARMQLGDEYFSATWTAGQAMTQEQAIAYALAEPDAMSRDAN
jgi:non-specific serine/threonine protein kinase